MRLLVHSTSVSGTPIQWDSSQPRASCSVLIDNPDLKALLSGEGFLDSAASPAHRHLPRSIGGGDRQTGGGFFLAVGVWGGRGLWGHCPEWDMFTVRALSVGLFNKRD